MALILSTAFREQLLGPAAFEDILGGGCIRLFSGDQPASADDAETGTLLGVLTANAGDWVAGQPTNGLTYSRAGIYVLKDPVQQWAFRAAADGVAGWFRIVGNAADDGALRTDLPRINGAIGLADETPQMIWSNTDVATGQLYQLDAFFFTLPPVPGS